MGTRLFETAKHAELYAKFRPRYGKDVFEAIVEFCRKGRSDFKLAVDVGCGSGQSTVPLTNVFKKVIGLDVSEKQIENARKNNENVEFRVGPAEDLSFLSDISTDLVTIAQAMHWVDAERFYSEVTRVLKPGGALVVYGYGLNSLDNKMAEAELAKFYNGTIGEYWDEKRKLVEEHYKSFSLPFPGWYRKDDLKISGEWTVDEFCGYVSSWSAWHKYLQQNPESKELDKLSERFKSLYTVNNQVHKMKIEWPVFMLMGYKPR